MSVLASMNSENQNIVGLLAKVCPHTEQHRLVRAVADMDRKTPDLLRLFNTMLGLACRHGVGVQERELVAQVVKQVFELVMTYDTEALQSQLQAVTQHIKKVVSGVQTAIAQRAINETRGGIDQLLRSSNQHDNTQSSSNYGFNRHGDPIIPTRLDSNRSRVDRRDNRSSRSNRNNRN